LKLKSLSDDFYEEVPIFHLFKELDKTIKEKKQYEVDIQHGAFRNAESVQVFMQKLDSKIADLDLIRLRHMNE